jgi:hypothetical protein
LGEVIWVEVLSRHHDVVARHRCVGPEVLIGRGYDNDVVIDDPYVAHLHVRIVREDDGTLVALDPGSANGLFAGHGTKRLHRIVLDGDHPIRIGHTYLRIREANHAVAQERLTTPPGRAWPVVLGLGVGLLALEGILLWLGETAEPKPSRYVLPLLGLTMAVLVWTTLWAILSRIFSGQARFERHLLIALTALVAYSFYNELVDYGAFALTWRVLAVYEYIGSWVFFAALCFLHLRAIGVSRLRLKAGIVAALAVVGISTQTLAQWEARSAADGYNYVRHLKPPALRLVSPQSESAFFADVQKLKSPLDRARTEDPISGGVSSLLDADD